MIDIISLINNRNVLEKIFIISLVILLVMMLLYRFNIITKPILLNKNIIKNNLTNLILLNIEKYTTDKNISDIIDEFNNITNTDNIILFYTEKSWSAVSNNNYIEDLTNNRYYIIDKDYYYLLLNNNNNNIKLVINNDSLKIKYFDFKKHSKKIKII